MKVYRLALPNSRGFSINKAYYKATFTRTRECRDWANAIIEKLQSPKNLAAVSAFKQKFDASNGAIGVFLKFHINRSVFYTKSKDISRFSMDLSNVEKLLVDLLFDKKYGIHALDLDDKLIVQLVSEKVPSDSFSIDIGLRILPRL